MKKIAFDILGNDNGIQAAIEAAKYFVSKELEYQITLIGDKKEIQKYITESERIIINHSPNVVNKSQKSLAARKDNTSMKTAINLLKDGEVDALLSSGDSASYLAMLTLSLKRLKGVRRPAFMPIIPTINQGKRALFLDVGANDVVTGEMLYQWGKIANIFAKQMLNISTPKISILNIGTEDNKGLPFHKEANDLLKKDKDLKYIGYIEPRYIFNGAADIYLSDGYGGNLILKSMEGTTLTLLKVIKRNIKSKFIYKVGGLLAKNAFKNAMLDLDYRNVGAAWVIGVNGLALKSHGSSDKQAYIGSLYQIKEVLDTNTFAKLKEAFNG